MGKGLRIQDQPNNIVHLIGLYGVMFKINVRKRSELKLKHFGIKCHLFLFLQTCLIPKPNQTPHSAEFTLLSASSSTSCPSVASDWIQSVA